MKWLFACLILWLSPIAGAAIDDAPVFSNSAQEARYYELIKEIRCPTCQNNNVAESNAPLARQLRGQIAGQIQAGKSKQEINTWLVARYGDFITYRPPFNPRTWLLWLLPAALMLLALIFWLIARHRHTAEQALSADEYAQLQQWLAQYREQA